jgi:hypothetical protein
MESAEKSAQDKDELLVALVAGSFKYAATASSENNRFTSGGSLADDLPAALKWGMPKCPSTYTEWITSFPSPSWGTCTPSAPVAAIFFLAIL